MNSTRKGTGFAGRLLSPFKKRPKGYAQLQFPLLIHSSPNAILITDTQSRIYYVNPSWEKLTGYSLEEVRGKNPRLLSSGKTPKRVYKKMMRMLRSGKSYSTDEICDKRKDGSEYQIHSSFYPVRQDHKNVFYVQVMYDITEQMRYAKKLEENEAKLRLILDNIDGYAVYTLDKTGHITSWSRGCEILKGYKEEEVLGKHYSMFYTKEDVKKRVPWKNLQQARTDGKIEVQGWRMKKNGKLFWVDMVLTAIKGPRGAVKGYVKIARDITPRKEIEQQKDTFIGIASHELKTPITTLKAYAQLLERRISTSTDSRINRLVSSIATQTERLTLLVDDLLNVSRLDSGTLALHKQMFAVDILIQDVVNNFMQIAGNHPILTHGKTNVKLSGDTHRLEQVLINLISNAAKYSPDGAKIIVHVKALRNQVVVGVQDFGLGIKKNDQEHVFERFYRTKDKEEKHIQGFGLGLYIAKEIVQRHKGSMWVESKKGHGSTFYFALPYI